MVRSEALKTGGLRGLFLGLAAAAALAFPAAAQDGDRPSVEEPQFFEDWGFRCSGDGEVSSCEIFQTLVVSENQQQLLHMAIGYVQGVDRPIGVLVVQTVESRMFANPRPVPGAPAWAGAYDRTSRR